MSGPRLIVRADGNHRIGYGHLVRCFSLAERWPSPEKVTFIGHNESLSHRRELEAFGASVVPLPDSCPPSVDLEAVRRESVTDGDWVVVDGYGFGQPYFDGIRALGGRLLVLDDTNRLETYGADILLNQNINARDLGYAGSGASVHLLGCRYALLRSAFLGNDPDKDIPDVATRVLVSMGGSDPVNASMTVLEGLAEAAIPGLDVVVIAGAANPRLDALKAASAAAGMGCRVLEHTDDMHGWMAWADIAVGAGGSSSWERAYFGLPSILLVTAENQRLLSEKSHTTGIVASLGWYADVTSSKVRDAVRELCYNRDHRLTQSYKGRHLVDGLGAERVVSAMMQGPPDDGHHVIRRATHRDTYPLWVLANDPDVRANAFHPDAIPLGDHVRWMTQKLTGESRIWVGELGDALAGQVRYDRIEDAAVVDIAVTRSCRGKGIGNDLILKTWETSCRELGVGRVRAVVHRSNVASCRMFLKAGFTKASDTRVDGFDCSVFEKSLEREA